MNNKFLAKQGRYGDTEIRYIDGEKAHVNTLEASLIDKYGTDGEEVVKEIGSGTVNPKTGLKEYNHTLWHWITNPYKSTYSAIQGEETGGDFSEQINPFGSWEETQPQGTGGEGFVEGLYNEWTGGDDYEDRVPEGYGTGGGYGREYAGGAILNPASPTSASYNVQQGGYGWLVPEWFQKRLKSGRVRSKEAAQLSKENFVKMFKSGDADGKSYYDYEFSPDEVEDLQWFRGDYPGITGAGGYEFEDDDAAYQAYINSVTDVQTSRIAGGDITPFGHQAAPDIFSEGSLLDAYTQAKGKSKLPSSVVPEFKIRDFRGLHSGYYTPEVEKRKKQLMTKYSPGVGGVASAAETLGGDFAGYGRRAKAKEDITSRYMTGVKDIYTDVVGGGQEDALKNLLDRLDMYDIAAEQGVSY